VLKRKNGRSDGVIKSSLGKGRWMIKWSDQEAQEEVHSRSLASFEEIEEESSSSVSSSWRRLSGREPPKITGLFRILAVD